MGKSETIEDKIKSDQEFRKFMDQLEQEAKAEEDRLLGVITSTAKRQYENNGWDYARLFGDKRSDYQNYADWSLARVTNIINTIGGALTASDFPSSQVPGSEKASKSTIEEAKEFISSFTGDYSLTIARVTALITGALSQFAVASEAKRSTVEQDLPMSGGMHLFFASTGNVFKRDTFFTNQFIGSFQIVFETYMSVDEARAIGLQQILKTTAQEIDMLNALIIETRGYMADSLKQIIRKNPEDYKTTKETYDLIVEDLKADRAKVLAEYDEYKNVVDTVDEYLLKLNLSSSGFYGFSEDGIDLEHLFNEKEAAIAHRYIRERLDG